MRIVQTFHPIKGTNLLSDSFGWLAPEYHLMGWTLSCLQLKKYYSQVCLYTSDLGAEILIDVLQLPYSEVCITHNNLSIPHNKLWAMPKIYTYSMQKEPFLHVDGDVFLFAPLSENLITMPLIAQNEEEATHFYTSTQMEIEKKLTYLPDIVKNDFKTEAPIHAINAGIIGGKDLSFFKYYTDLAFKYINLNSNNLSSIDVNKFNVFYEQHLFYCCAQDQEKNIGYYFDHIFSDNQYSGLASFWEVPYARKYLHLLGEFKRNVFACKKLAEKLREDYPEYYYRIIALFKRNNYELKYDYYDLDTFSVSRLLEFNKKSKKNYSNQIFYVDKKETDEKIIFETLMNRHESMQIKEMIKSDNNFERNDLITNYKNFVKNVANIVKENSTISSNYLYGRDIEALSWYRLVFGKEKSNGEIRLVKCPEVDTLSSKYNWGAFWCKYNQLGSPYYDELKIEEGDHPTIIIPEANKFGFSIYDLEKLDIILLDIVKNPKTINSILDEVKYYFEDQVINENFSKVRKLVHKLLSQLILKKAIKPLIE
jgi:Txe/YoeB family toxin of Txe-Axe toxin-antitoxin module